MVEPGGGRLLIDTGNAPWNGSTNFGDSVLELTFPGLERRQAYTPTDQEQLNNGDTDLGSSAPALLSEDRVVLAGKDGSCGCSRSRAWTAGRRRRARRSAGKSSALRSPAAASCSPHPRCGAGADAQRCFVAGENGTGAYVMRRGRLYLAWQNHTPGTSPVMAGGLLYVYDPSAGGIDVYRPGSPNPIAKLPGGPGHWNSSIVVDGHVVEPEGNANDHSLSGTLEIFSAG